MTQSIMRAHAIVSSLVLPGVAAAQATTFALESAQGLRLHSVVAESATHQGKKGVRVTVAHFRNLTVTER